MNKRNKIENLFIIFIIIMWGVDLFQMTMIHEKTHQRILYEYDTKSKIVFNNPITNFKEIFNGQLAYTLPENMDKCNENCINLNLQTEIVGYHIGVIQNTLWSIFMLSLFYIIYIKKDKKG